MNFKCFLIFAVFISTTNAVQAIVHESSDPDTVISAKLEHDRKKEDTKKLLKKEINRVEASRLRADKIRNLPPEAIPLWVASNKSDATLDEYTVSASSKMSKAKQALVSQQDKKNKTKHLLRFLAVLLVIFICGVLKYRNTRKFQS